MNYSKNNVDGSVMSLRSLDLEDDLNSLRNEEKEHVSIRSQTNPNCRLCWDDAFSIENPLL